MSPEPDESDPATAMYRHRLETVAVDRGTGPPVVFSHGTLMDWTMFEPQLDALSEEYRTVAYNHRARTEQGHEPYDLDDLVADCEAVLDAAGIDSCVLAGMSMGGLWPCGSPWRIPNASTASSSSTAWPNRTPRTSRTSTRT